MIESEGKIYFSYSLWGSLPKYTRGMIINSQILYKLFPESVIQIYVAEDVPADIIKNLLEIPIVKIVNVLKKPGIQNMFDRFKAIDEPDCSIMFVRDADSRPHERDLSCMEDFIKSDKQLHIVRDHDAHRAPILGGLWGMRKSGLHVSMTELIDEWFKNNSGSLKKKKIDQYFLAEIFYPRLKSNAVIHDRFKRHEDPQLQSPFRVPIKKRLFCGQVHLFDESGNEYLEFRP